MCYQSAGGRPPAEALGSNLNPKTGQPTATQIASRCGLGRGAPLACQYMHGNARSPAASLPCENSTDALPSEGKKRRRDVTNRPPKCLNRQAFALGADLDRDVRALTEEWGTEDALRRLWQKDESLWTGADENNWMGWLDIVDHELTRIAEYRNFGEEVRRERFSDAVLLGMGGSSLGPEVLADIFGSVPGYPRLRILDSTDPAQLRATEEAVALDKTLFIVSSKSGSTLEPNILKDHFFERVKSLVGAERAGGRFIVVTDPGSSLEKTARVAGFRRIFHGDPSIGGRYSVLSAFGLVPAAAIGLDVGRLLDDAHMMMRSCGPNVPAAENPGVQLGLAMGAAERQGHDKVTIVTAAKISGFGAWAEQLIAESTGKDGRGLIPVDGEPLGPPEVYGRDRLFIQLRLEGASEPLQEAALAALEEAGHPIVRIDIASLNALVQEFVRWEFAIAAAGVVIGINPFDQPDVEASKVRTRELTSAFEEARELPADVPVIAREGIELYTDRSNAEALRQAGAGDSIESWLRAHFDRIRPGDYLAILAYVARSSAHREVLDKARLALRDAKRVATCLGFGPRFLHSTGQAYKGGPNSGVFLQITTEGGVDLTVPGRRYSFGVVEAAQARGDFEVLAERGRRALRLHLKTDITAGLESIVAMTRQALG